MKGVGGVKLKKYWLAALVTLTAGMAASLCGSAINWPELGGIVAAAVMGGFVIHTIEEKK